MVVPTMLARIVTAMEDAHPDVSTLKSLSYGGAKVAERVLLDALRLFPDTDFVNAYGLTETASTIAVLGPADHRAALESDDEQKRRRLLSVGRLLPTIDIEVRDEDNRPQPVGTAGLIYLRGEQIAGEYAAGSVLSNDGWFCTGDRGYVDPDGYTYIEGRSDDTIIRGGENLAPAEIEAALLAHPSVQDACVVGLPDEEWGQRIAAAVVLRPGHVGGAAELQQHVKGRLRGSKVPDVIVFRASLPHTDTGKLLRRVVLDDFMEHENRLVGND
jgi:acyl-CoA synthetase (AMP-forming)/AMP-acid ligase II